MKVFIKIKAHHHPLDFHSANPVKYHLRLKILAYPVLLLLLLLSVPRLWLHFEFVACQRDKMVHKFFFH